LLIAPINDSGNKAPHKFTRIAAGIGVSALTAVMLILAFHPYNVWFLAFFAFVPVLIAQHRILPRKWSGLARRLAGLAEFGGIRHFYRVAGEK
jgi:apolipoprotein N-acyltransferase